METGIAWLQAEFVRRRRRNARYSLRAFASFLGLPPGRLSELLNAKRRLTPPLLEKIASRLGLSPEERAKLLGDLTHAPGDEAISKRALAEDEFAVIADWEHFAILSLLATDEPPATSKAIGDRLGISAVEAKVAVGRLERLGLIRRSESGWLRTEARLRVGSAAGASVANAALRRSHRQNLEHAIAMLEEAPLEERSITSVTMAIDPALLPVAKRLIARFEAAMEHTLESGRRTEVYNLNIQLVPVTKRKKT